MTTTKKAGFLIALSTFFALAVVELGVRVIYPKVYWSKWDSSKDWKYDEELGWTNRPNLDTNTLSRFSAPVRFQTNSDGITPGHATRKRKKNIKRILIIGDSIVLGRAIPYTGTLHASLERVLRQENISVEVFNAGVEGYSTDQSWLRLKRLVPKYKPDLVIYGFCSNDFLGNAKNSMGRLPKPRFVINKDGSISFVEAPFREISPKANPSFASLEQPYNIRRLLSYWATYQVVRPKLISLFSNNFLKSNNLVRGIDSELYYDEDVRKHLDKKLLSMLLTRMYFFSKKHGANFLYYSHPDMLEIWDPAIDLVIQERKIPKESYNRYALENMLSDISKIQGIKFVPMIDYFLERKSQGPFHMLPLDAHSNATGYYLTAKRLAEFIEDDHLL